jgi:hypothetical protein
MRKLHRRARARQLQTGSPSTPTTDPLADDLVTQIDFAAQDRQLHEAAAAALNAPITPPVDLVALKDRDEWLRVLASRQAAVRTQERVVEQLKRELKAAKVELQREVEVVREIIDAMPHVSPPATSRPSKSRRAGRGGAR